MTVRLAICVPCRDMMHSVCSFSLYNLAAELTSVGIEHRLFLSPGTLIANQRHELVLAAKEWSATHVMFIDSDIEFKPEHVISLIDFDELVVGAAYSKRVEPIITTAWHSIDDWNSFVKPEEQTDSHIQVEAMALGFCLIKTEVFDQLSLPWFQLGFYNNQYTGEDIEFFRKCVEANIPIWLDIATTCQLGHIGIKNYKVVDDIEVVIATSPTND
jgi:hypothetical protein